MITTADTIEMSRREILECIEEGAQARVGMSAIELLQRYREGRLSNPGEVADILVLSDLLDPDDPIFN